MDLKVMNMPCTSLCEMAEVTDKIFTSAAAETTPFPRMVINHIALRRTLKYFEPEHVRFTQRFVTDEVTAYVETVANIARTLKNKKSATGTIFVSGLYVSTQTNTTIPVPGARIRIRKRLAEVSAEVLKALQAYSGYKGSSQVLIDEA